MPTSLPSAGTAFAVRLSDGRYGVCRVLARSGDAIVLAATPWVGDEAALGPELLDHPELKQTLCFGRTTEPPPAKARKLGLVSGVEVPRGVKLTTARTSWSKLAGQILFNWRWQHDLAAVLAENAAKREAKKSKEKTSPSKEQQDPLAALADRAFFEEWTDHHEAKIVRASEKIVHDAIGKIARLGAKQSEAAVLAALVAAVERFNALDEKQGGFIDTIEREAIDEALFAVARVCGVSEAAFDAAVGAARDW